MSPTPQDVAREALTYFGTAERPDGTTFVRTTRDRPEWVVDLCHAAHGDMLPDDYRYSAIRSALDYITKAADLGDPQDTGHEWADAEVDIHGASLAQWLASHLDRQGRVDEAADDLVRDGATVSERMMAGQYLELTEIWSLLWDALEQAAEDLECSCGAGLATHPDPMGGTEVCALCAAESQRGALGGNVRA